MDGQRYLLMLGADGRYVTVYTDTSCLGSWQVERFGGALTPASIRTFLQLVKEIS